MRNTTNLVPGMCLVNCGHCGEAFLFNTLVNQLVRCPHCEKKSSVGYGFAKCRGLIFMIFALITLILAIVVTVITNGGPKGWIVIYLILYALALGFTFRSVYFYTIKKSTIVDSQT